MDLISEDGWVGGGVGRWGVGEPPPRKRACVSTVIYAHGRLLPHQLKQEQVPASVARTRTSRWARGQSRTEIKGSERRQGRQGREGSEGRRRLPSVIGGVWTAHVPDESHKIRSVDGRLENMTEIFSQSLKQKTLHASKLKTGASPRVLLTPGGHAFL